MTASINLIKASDGTGNAAVATVQSSRSPGATTILVNTVENIPASFMGTMGTPHTFTDPVTSEVITVISEASAVDFTGHVSSTHLEIDSIAPGYTDGGSSVGDIVIIKPTTQWADNVAAVLDVAHADDGTINASAIYDTNGNEEVKFTTTASATNEVTIKNAANGSAPIISATGSSDANVNLNLQGKGTGNVTVGAPGLQLFPYDYVASGCVWSGDAYASTRAASMTAGVVVINGKPVSIAAVVARTFTASKDTYIDVDASGTITYTEVTNNAASPALAANNLRLGIIVTGASNIAAAGSINQGEENKILPIASSIAYTTTDSLGNLICPRDPNRRLLGYRQITTSATQTSGTATQVTGLTCPVIVPTGRKVKVSFYTDALYNVTASDGAILTIWDGVVASGTQLNQGDNITVNGVVSYATPTVVFAMTTPAAASKTYNIGLHRTGGGTATVTAQPTYPAFIMVELV